VLKARTNTYGAGGLEQGWLEEQEDVSGGCRQRMSVEGVGGGCRWRMSVEDVDVGDSSRGAQIMRL